ncbi:protein of unknown function DUF205 [Alkaliphilus metalliredigens QYMF]|uniref:Glycerol-3-phosphate acyltransferase n=1 Tax=Alkaliphilus metalliredigens (strain QYMF) TaxID=293826 RepID=PLSY_ALKMQ|nr:glycerol-3-phosphate 1-O-acyltransferase PlsY [Alkaliphilus metalliredigens]A6TS38.1 RecName: Full=Glycerol-3-phosphate acyltransferase; AltName: Full=Acyl-PO4 G3P acyltransferase; AltName: Full=Acyl-phosphate--glycerol-3-phosphate acyltransferase; AltName: Full=G3P acyltransferase; Short=GPAT; AltName: Full=Lysophosphatidic acid synthase; Short=LPA synthase [Alkaliphilus metalliredigens QYMF]ABR49006.1 protein of unknown function DUF205 [Alkaliphilus metalliredigens QYMF]
MINLLVIISAYFIGNFSTSFIVGKLTSNIDIRQHGSGNAGSTNVLRTLGVKAAALTFLGDTLKGMLSFYLAQRFVGEQAALMAGIAVVIGHNWPVLLGFKGGKGIATTIGVALIASPLAAIASISLGVVILYRYKYVSLSSITAMTILPFFLFSYGLEYFIFGLVLSVMAIYRHRENIKRLRTGTEKKIGRKTSV